MKIFSSAQNYIKKNITSPAIQRIIFFDMLLLGLLFLAALFQTVRNKHRQTFTLRADFNLKFKAFLNRIFIIYIFKALECRPCRFMHRTFRSNGDNTYLIDMQ